MKNSAEICLMKYDRQAFMREIQDIRGDKNLVSFGTISYHVKYLPEKYPYLKTHFFHKSEKWARNQITQYLDKCGYPQRNKKRGVMAVYMFTEGV